MLVFSVDPGTNSAGWAAFDLFTGSNVGLQIKLLGAGVCLFGGRTNARPEREPTLPDRHRYRRRRRTLRRKLIALLLQSGLLPCDEFARTLLFAQDPYEIRARGLTHRLTGYELGRAICHIGKRKGLADHQARGQVPVDPDGYPTWGAWLWSRHSGAKGERLATRNRLQASAKIEQNLAPPRCALEHEFDLLWKTQGLLQDRLPPDAVRDEIRQVLFCNGPGKRTRTANKRLAGPYDQLVQVAFNRTRKMLKVMGQEFGTPDVVAVENFAAVCTSGKSCIDEQARRNSQYRQTQAVNNGRKRLQLLKRQQAAAGGQAFCPYTGAVLNRALVLSAQVQVDHIIPAKHNGGSHPDNLVLCLADANRAKADRTPYQAFASTGRWHDIRTRSKRLPSDIRENLLARCVPKSTLASGFDVHQKYAMRQIVNRIRLTIGDIFPAACVRLVDPQTTIHAKNRHKLETCLGDGPSQTSKNRFDHRHHTVDAVAVGLAVLPIGTTDPDFAIPLRDIKKVLTGVVASATPQHGQSGPMHKRTIYGNPGNASGTAIHRKMISDLSATEIGNVRDLALRRTLQSLTVGKSAAVRRKLLMRFSEETGVRRARLLRRLSNGIYLEDKKTGASSRVVLPSGNHHLDIVANRNGRWHAFGETTHSVRQPGWRPQWERSGCGFKLVMRLHKADMIEIDEDGTRVLRRVIRLVPSGERIFLADPNAAGSLATRNSDPADPFRWQIVSAETLRKRRARAVRIDMLGRARYRKSNVTLDQE